jgi:hypothetical protein
MFTYFGKGAGADAARTRGAGSADHRSGRAVARKSCSTKCSRWPTTPTSTRSSCTSTACARSSTAPPGAAAITTLRGIGYLLQPRAAGEIDEPAFRPPVASPRRRRLGSLRGQLLRWLLLPLVVLVALNTVSVYHNALDAADMAYDRSLLASTRALAERVSIVDGKVVADVPYVALDSFETDTLGRIYYKVTGLQRRNRVRLRRPAAGAGQRAALRTIRRWCASTTPLQRPAGPHRRAAAAGVRRHDARHRADPGRRDAGRAARR